MQHAQNMGRVEMKLTYNHLWWTILHTHAQKTQTPSPVREGHGNLDEQGGVDHVLLGVEGPWGDFRASAAV